uniref:T-box domain-containing protein n=1 Tax=Panagrellus redivivus TaxID=6233 RepID=A0A7E4WBU5_PANRE
MNRFMGQPNPWMQLIDSGTFASSLTPTVPDIKNLPKLEPQEDKKPLVDALYAVQEDITDEALKERIDVKLHDHNLWAKFADIEVEMIVTKTGRNLFPKLAFNVTGLEPRNRYLFYVEFRLVAEEKWKFSLATGGWESYGRADAYSPTIYPHHENVNFPTGAAWMENSFTFNAKLTNQIELSGKSRFIYVSSMHKYIPVVMIHRFDPATKTFNAFTEVEIPTATFIATTAYQNDKCKVVKVCTNPFAKGFREDGRKRKKMERKAVAEGSPASPVPEPFNPFSRLNQTYPPAFLPNFFGISNPAFYWNYMSSLAQQPFVFQPPPPPPKEE